MEKLQLKNDIIRHILSRNKKLYVEPLKEFSFDELLCYVDPSYREYYIKLIKELN